jgi:uroporphyrinogen-III synthase
MPPFLLTRPEDQNTRFAGELALRFGPGIRVIGSPLLELVDLEVDLAPLLSEPGVSGLVFTSENAVHAFRRKSAQRDLCAYCVGARTAAAARAAGLQAVSADGDAAALVALIKGLGVTGQLIHLRGAHSLGGVAATLRLVGIAAIDAVIYDQKPRKLSDPAISLLAQDEPVLLPVFSPRTALLFAQAVASLCPKAPILAAPISAATAQGLAGLPLAGMQIAAEPTAAGVLDALAALIAAGGYT